MYPEDSEHHVESWTEDAFVGHIIHIKDDWRDHHCGYARFPKRFLKEEGYYGIVTYVPVHGGVTYAEEDEDGSICYGFDCAHFNDKDNPVLHERKWLRDEVTRMAAALMLATKYEERFLLCGEDIEARDKVIDEYDAEVLEGIGVIRQWTNFFGDVFTMFEQMGKKGES